MVPSKSRRGGHKSCFQASEQEVPTAEILDFGRVDASGFPAPKLGCLGDLGTLGGKLSCFFLILAPYVHWDASQSVAGAALPPRIAIVLGQLFDGLKMSTALSAPWQYT